VLIDRRISGIQRPHEGFAATQIHQALGSGFFRDTALDRSGHPNPVPRVTGKVRRKHPVEVRDVEFLRANTDGMIKITVPGPKGVCRERTRGGKRPASFWRSISQSGCA
jgi:hypothetical protein